MQTVVVVAESGRLWWVHSHPAILHVADFVWRSAYVAEAPTVSGISIMMDNIAILQLPPSGKPFPAHEIELICYTLVWSTCMCGIGSTHLV